MDAFADPALLQTRYCLPLPSTLPHRGVLGRVCGNGTSHYHLHYHGHSLLAGFVVVSPPTAPSSPPPAEGRSKAPAHRRQARRPALARRGVLFPMDKSTVKSHPIWKYICPWMASRTKRRTNSSGFVHEPHFETYQNL